MALFFLIFWLWEVGEKKHKMTEMKRLLFCILFPNDAHVLARVSVTAVYFRPSLKAQTYARSARLTAAKLSHGLQKTGKPRYGLDFDALLLFHQ